MFQWECLPIHPVEHLQGHINVGARRTGSQSPFQFIPKVFDAVEVTALYGPIKFFHTKPIQPCLYGPCWNRKGHFPNSSYKVGSIALSKMCWYAEAFRLPFTGIKGLSTPMKNSLMLLSILHQTLQLAKCSQARDASIRYSGSAPIRSFSVDRISVRQD